MTTSNPTGIVTMDETKKGTSEDIVVDIVESKGCGSPESSGNMSQTPLDPAKKPAKDKVVLYERLFGGLPKPVRWIVNCFFLFSLLYLFLLGLNLMGNAFKGMSGKSVGNMFTSINNPLAGLTIGIL